MTVWTMGQVQRVRALRSAVDIAREIIDSSQREVTAETIAADRMFRVLADMAHPLGVDIHPGDVATVVTEPPGTYVAHIVMGWAPSTRACRFDGGPIDGTVYVLPQVGPPILIPTVQGVDTWADDGTRATLAVPTSRTMTYVLSGWHEQDRHWVYTPTRDVSHPSGTIRP